MKSSFKNSKIQINVDFTKPVDVSIPLRAGSKNVNAWYVDPVKIEAVRTEQFVGSVAEGGSVNFRNIQFNPHGNGTHTECVGHISKAEYSINQCLKSFLFYSQVLSIKPSVQNNGDQIICGEDLEGKLLPNIEALLIRTLPNPLTKMEMQYSNTNPPYLDEDFIKQIIDHGVKHLLIDLPSVDRELDDGVLAAHHLFWDYPADPKFDRTITEMIYIPDEIKDGNYLLNLQIASFENDASPSKPVLYPII